MLLTIQQFLDSVDVVSDHLGWSVDPILELEQLRTLPLGSLGRTLADFLDRHQMDPLTTGPRRKQLHDSVHVLTGYGTDPLGELEVQVFLLGSKFRLPHLLISLGLLRILRKHSIASDLSYEVIWNRIRAAFVRGQRSAFDLDRWHPEHQWHLPLAKVQAQFQIEG